jgi:hypothetical protein
MVKNKIQGVHKMTFRENVVANLIHEVNSEEIEVPYLVSVKGEYDAGYPEMWLEPGEREGIEIEKVKVLMADVDPQPWLHEPGAIIELKDEEKEEIEKAILTKWRELE